MRTSDLKPYPDNPRIHGDGSGLRKSILELGDLSGVVFNVRNRLLVGGHYRSKTIPKESTIESHPVKDTTGTVAEGTIILPGGQRLNYREVDWDETKHKLACVEANNQKIQGEWNSELLEPLLADLYEDISELDFEEFRLDELSGVFDFYLGSTNINDGGGDENQEDKTGYIELIISHPQEGFEEFEKTIENAVSSHALAEIRRRKIKDTNSHELRASVFALINYHLKQPGDRESPALKDRLGYSITDLIKHLEENFDGSMNWENYGKHWEIDHKIPVSWFRYDSFDHPQFKECWRLDNLQPLSVKNNRKKGNKFEV